MDTSELKEITGTSNVPELMQRIKGYNRNLLLLSRIEADLEAARRWNTAGRMAKTANQQDQAPIMIAEIDFNAHITRERLIAEQASILAALEYQESQSSAEVVDG